jgi:hypothetical protein
MTATSAAGSTIVCGPRAGLSSSVLRRRDVDLRFRGITASRIRVPGFGDGSAEDPRLVRLPPRRDGHGVGTATGRAQSPQVPSSDTNREPARQTSRSHHQDVQ